MRTKKNFKIGRDLIKTLHCANVSFFSREKTEKQFDLTTKYCLMRIKKKKSRSDVIISKTHHCANVSFFSGEKTKKQFNLTTKTLSDKY